jgi:hypothetical protein
MVVSVRATILQGGDIVSDSCGWSSVLVFMCNEQRARLCGPHSRQSGEASNAKLNAVMMPLVPVLQCILGTVGETQFRSLGREPCELTASYLQTFQKYRDKLSKYRDRNVLRNVGDHIPVNTVSYPRRLEF